MEDFFIKGTFKDDLLTFVFSLISCQQNTSLEAIVQVSLVLFTSLCTLWTKQLITVYYVINCFTFFYRMLQVITKEFN